MIFLNSLIFWFYVILLVMTAVLGNIFTNPKTAQCYYNQLSKPPYSPPAKLFPIVWIIIYILLVIIGYIGDIAATGDGPYLFLIRTFFILQLILIIAWSIMFFGLHSPKPAMFINIVLIVTVLVLMVLYWKHSPLASILMIPYLGWLIFALYLNQYIVAHNCIEPCSKADTKTDCVTCPTS